MQDEKTSGYVSRLEAIAVQKSSQRQVPSPVAFHISMRSLVSEEASEAFIRIARLLLSQDEY